MEVLPLEAKGFAEFVPPELAPPPAPLLPKAKPPLLLPPAPNVEPPALMPPVLPPVANGLVVPLPPWAPNGVEAWPTPPKGVLPDPDGAPEPNTPAEPDPNPCAPLLCAGALAPAPPPKPNRPVLPPVPASCLAAFDPENENMPDEESPPDAPAGVAKGLALGSTAVPEPTPDAAANGVEPAVCDAPPDDPPNVKREPSGFLSPAFDPIANGLSDPPAAPPNAPEEAGAGAVALASPFFEPKTNRSWPFVSLSAELPTSNGLELLDSLFSPDPAPPSIADVHKLPCPPAPDCFSPASFLLPATSACSFSADFPNPNKLDPPVVALSAEPKAKAVPDSVAPDNFGAEKENPPSSAAGLAAPPVPSDPDLAAVSLLSFPKLNPPEDAPEPVPKATPEPEAPDPLSSFSTGFSDLSVFSDPTPFASVSLAELPKAKLVFDDAPNEKPVDAFSPSLVPAAAAWLAAFSSTSPSSELSALLSLFWSPAPTAEPEPNPKPAAAWNLKPAE
mmetsp:Transcript_4843/g.13562  ORF Transcript_4843/g.13562 Transcript_4843/m.13562 type:complete len:504 (+) Transcript_4843:242-1753(+)